MSSQDKRRILEETMTHQQEALLGVIQSYVVRMGAASISQREQVAAEIYSDMAYDALRHAQRYDSRREAFPWLLGIALNHIRRRRQNHARRSKREIPIREMFPNTEMIQSDGELFDQVGSSKYVLKAFEASDYAEQLLALLNENDAQIIRLAILQDLDSESIGQQLGISASAARVRLHRALKRLRGAISMQQETSS